MRLFAAIELPRDLRHRLAALRGGLSRARWVEADNIHLSLRFIGEVTGGDAEDVDAALQTVTGPEFEIAFTGLGCFERRRRVHAVWAGVDASTALTRLQAKVESALVRAGCAPEGRKFKAHVTLARLKDGRAAEVGRFLEAHNGFRAGPVPVDHFTLFRSHLGGEGARYEALAEYPLQD